MKGDGWEDVPLAGVDSSPTFVALDDLARRVLDNQPRSSEGTGSISFSNTDRIHYPKKVGGSSPPSDFEFLRKL